MKQKNNNVSASSLLTTAIASSLVISGSQVFAQAKEAAWLEEIVVTAQNREQAIEDVPISMNVLNGDKLSDAGITDIRNLNRLAPDFSTTNDGESTRLSLRGISTESNDEGVDQALTINVDGEYINRPRLLNAVLFDLERVEVLRGPQGTLYGRNATGGALNIIAKKPQLEEFSGDVSLDFGNYGKQVVNAAVNLPLGDIAAVRMALMSTEQDGFWEHDNVGVESGGGETQAGRIGLQLEPTDELSVYLAYEKVESEPQAPLAAAYSDNVSQQSGVGTGQCNTGAGWDEIFNGGGVVLCAPYGTNNLSQVDATDYDAPNTASLGEYEINSDAFRAQLTYDLENVSIAYRGGYREADMSGAFPLHPGYLFYRNEEAKTQSHEIRFSGGSDGLYWQTGAFYMKETLEVASGLLSYIGAYPFGPQGYFVNTFFRPDLENESKALFGQVDMPVSDTMTVIAGLRYTQDDKSGTVVNLPGALTFDERPTLRPIDSDGATEIPVGFDNNELTWSIGLNWEPNDTSLYYTKLSKGYKAGGFDSPGNAFDPETLIAWEAGLKNSYDSWSVDFSAFYYDYKDLQVSVLIDTNKGAEIFNAGGATIYGMDAAFEFYLSDTDLLTFTANYLSTQYDEFETSLVGQEVTATGFDNTSTGPLGLLYDLEGNDLPNAPKFIFTLGYDHVWNWDFGSLTASLFTRWKDDYYMSPFNYSDGNQESFTQTDASLSFTSSDDAWDVQLYVRNLEDEQPMTYHGFTVAGPDDVQLWYFGAPRTYGAKIGYRF